MDNEYNYDFIHNTRVELEELMHQLDEEAKFTDDFHKKVEELRDEAMYSEDLTTLTVIFKAYEASVERRVELWTRVQEIYNKIGYSSNTPTKSIEEIKKNLDIARLLMKEIFGIQTVLDQLN